MARAIGRDAFEALVREDEALMQRLGMVLLSVDGGLSFAHKEKVVDGTAAPWDRLEMTEATWSWVRPHLQRAAAVVEDTGRREGTVGIGMIEQLFLQEPAQLQEQPALDGHPALLPLP